MSRPKGTNTIRALLDSGHAIISTEGLGKLTLDAVVGRTQLSKGALLHHFKSKEQLTRRLLQDAIDDFDRTLSTIRGTDRTPGSYTRAYIRATLSRESSMSGRRNMQVIAALARESSLRPILGRAVGRWSRQVEADGIDGVLAQILRAAADGLWLANTAGVQGVSPRMRPRLISKLLELAGPEGA